MNTARVLTVALIIVMASLALAVAPAPAEAAPAAADFQCSSLSLKMDVGKRKEIVDNGLLRLYATSYIPQGLPPGKTVKYATYFRGQEVNPSQVLIGTSKTFDVTPLSNGSTVSGAAIFQATVYDASRLICTKFLLVEFVLYPGGKMTTKASTWVSQSPPKEAPVFQFKWWGR